MRYVLHPQPPSGGCVLKQVLSSMDFPNRSPAAFRRLCVETIELDLMDEYGMASRLQAAVC